MGALRAIILGAGYRGRAYAAYAKAHPDELEIVGVADPHQAGSIAAPRTWLDWRECLSARPEAELAILTLPDAQHHEAALRALEGGYHLLLEKPLATTAEGCREVVVAGLRARRLVMVGHVLRHVARYAYIKALIESGELGEVVSISHQESVGFAKMSHSFVRGELADSAESSPMILTKCSHDFDLFVWWIGRRCRKVASFGSTRLFSRENAPTGAGARCTACPAAIESSCVWSARRLYSGGELGYLFADASAEAMERVVEESRYGRCVYRCENDAPDHQGVLLEFEGGATVSHMMTGFSMRNVRTTRIGLTRGEIVCEGDRLEVLPFDGAATGVRVPRVCEPNLSRHGGGDFNLMADAIRLVRRGDAREWARQTESALASHLIAFAAEESRRRGGEVLEVEI